MSTTTERKTLAAWLREHRACSEGYRYASVMTLAEFWEQCPRIDWMLWVLNQCGYLPEHELRLSAVWCARQALKLIENPDPRSVTACDVAERYANGNATTEELAAARAAAWAAARAAARAAAWDAARHAARAAARAAAWDAARHAAMAAQADNLRTLIHAEDFAHLIEEEAQ